MRITLVSALVAMLAFVAGCGRESPKGGPGANTGNTNTRTTTPTNDNDRRGGTQTTETKRTTTTTTNDNDNNNTNTNNQGRDTFSIKVPDGENVTQGKRDEVTISINRDGNFKDGVKLSFRPPAGLKVVPEQAEIKANESKTNVFVEATENATVGRHNITVTATPPQGKATSVEMRVDVKARD